LFGGIGLSNWKIGGSNTNAITMQNMFGLALVFNEPVNSWETNAGSTMAYVTNLNSTFNTARAFNPTVGDWNVGRVTGFAGTFANTNVWEDPAPSINNWHIGENTGTTAIAMNSMFQSALKFNSPLDTWETDANSTIANVTNLSNTFNNARVFNQPLGDWDVGRVTNFTSTFQSTLVFSDPAPSIANWNIGQNTGTTAITMNRMFNGALAFNTNISSWETGANSTTAYVTDMQYMFNDADAYNQPLGDWDVGRVANFTGMFRRTAIFADPAPSINNCGILVKITNLQALTC